MLLVLTGQLTFGSLDDACKKEQGSDCSLYMHTTMYSVGVMTTKTFTKLPNFI